MKFDYEHPELAEVDFGKFASGASGGMAPGPAEEGETSDLGAGL